MGAPSGTVTFLFTDIEGSTGLWESAPDAMRTALARHDEIVRGSIEAHDGYVFSTGGDGFGAAFARAGDAVGAAVDVQRALTRGSWPRDAPIRVRMGLHTGEVTERDGDYFGTPVNQAARLTVLAHGGQVLCSAVTAGLLGADASVVDLGVHRLRDLSAPQRVFQLGEGGFPALRSVDAYPGNLPALLTSFIGRDDELALVAKALGGSRLVTLTGTGGVGKTRLALQAAADALPSFADGAWLCELAAASDRDSMLQVVAIGLGLTPRQGVALARGIAEFVGNKRLLLVLDNCEHLLDAATELAETVLAACPQARMLATSREALGLAGERVVRLRSLSLPQSGADLEELVSSDAARLFMERAEATGVEVALSVSDAGAIAEICRRLDGIPLAIELAAARVIALSPAEIAAHLDERFRLLTGGRRAAVERHHTLRATVDWSYSLLSATEQQVFDRLGVFPAAFDAAAAKAVVTSDGIEDWDVVDALTSLVGKSMVVADRGDGGSTSYQMLETLRHYARERLDASGSADDTRRRHARHFAQLADALSVGLRGAEAYASHTRVNADLDNFRAAVLWSLDSPEDDDAELAMRIIGNLWISADWGTSGIGAWAEQAVERARSGNQRFVGVILSVAAANLFYRGEFSVGRALSAEALDASVEGSLFPGTPYQSAAVFHRPDELPVLLATGVEALQRAHASDWEIASLRVVVAAMAAIGGRHDLAEMEASAALGSGRRSNNPYMIALALYTHALCCYQTQPDTALAALDEYIAMAQMGASRNVLARSLALSSQIRASMGHAERALGDLQEAIEVAHRTGDRPSMAFTLARAVAVLRQDDPTAAAVLSGVVGTGALARQFAVLTWEREWFQGVLEEIKVLLGEERFEQAVAQGAALTYDDAVALASDAVEDQVAGVEGALGLGLRTQRHV